MKKIKILFANPDQAGVFYYRTLTPALQLQQSFSEEFDVEINQNVDWNDVEYLKKFDIIHSHRQFVPKSVEEGFFNWAKENNIKLVLDIDDYWVLGKEHPLYQIAKVENMAKSITDTIKLCDAVTTTTDYFRDIILKHNKNVIALNNGVNPEIMPQFNYARADDEKLRFGIICGSSHLHDIMELDNLGSVIHYDNNLKGKYRLSLHGYDLRGSITNIDINPDLVRDLIISGQDVQKISQELSKNSGDISKCSISPDLKMKYLGIAFKHTNRDILPHESVWFKYEEILTDKYKSIKDPNYLAFLKEYKNENYTLGVKDQFYARHFTKGIHSYATHYDEIDVSLVPLLVNEFNLCKSPLKIAEAQAKNVAMIVSDNPIYTKYIKHGHNGLIAKDERDWTKLIKRLINEKGLAKQLADQLREDTKDEFDLVKITEKRAEFYKDLINK